MNPETIPLLLVALLLLTAGGDVSRADVVFDGTHEAGEAPLVVAGGVVTVSENATTPGPVYVVNGTLDVRGTVAGDLQQLGGNVTVADGARVGGTYRPVGGGRTVAPEADVTVQPVAPSPAPSPLLGPSLFALQTAVLALAGFLLGRRRPALLETVGAAAQDHPAVSLTVGVLVGLSALSLAVFMAFTLVLLPVSLLGLLVGIVVTGYGVLALGHLLGEWFGRFGIEDQGWATALGVVALSVGLELLGFLPFGDFAALLVVTTGLGAALVSYLGFRRFEPAFVVE